MLDEIRNLLRQRQVAFTEKMIQHGTQLRCPTGEVFNVYDSGKLVVGGKATPLAEEIRARASGSGSAAEPAEGEERASTIPTSPNRQVFVVYGHDQGARDALELLLLKMGLQPIILQHLAAAGDTIVEKLEKYLGDHANVGFACVLLTPDDEGHIAGRPDEKKYRARQNVLLELGMVLARLGRRRVAILTKESVERPSDIAGLIYIAFRERVDEVKAQLFRELREAGYSPKPDAL